jgi:hypothetical protein
MSPGLLLKIMLTFTAIHSFGVGLGMIFLPVNIIAIFSVIPSEHQFFITQAGVFHIVMCIAYCSPIYNLKYYRSLVVFSIIAKYIGATFLLTYFIFGNQFWLVLLSAAGDFVMGTALFILYSQYTKSES